MGLKDAVGKKPFYISEVLTTRVEATPKKLGEYRTMRKLPSSVECFDEESSFPPTLADGMFISGKSYSQGGLAENGGEPGKPNRWEIFVGQYKQLDWRFYKDADVRGNLNTDLQFTLFPPTTFALIGLLKTYNEHTGVVSVDTAIQSSIIGSRLVGIHVMADGANPEYMSEGYFDILVS